MGSFKTLKVEGFQPALQGMRLPLKSGERADSHWVNDTFVIGPNDYGLAKRLIKAGTEHRKFLRMIQVWVEIQQPRYFFQEWDTYKIATVSNSESTMHKLLDEDLKYSDFDIPQFDRDDKYIEDIFKQYLKTLIVVKEKACASFGSERVYYHHLLKAMLPESFKQKRVVSLNYETLNNMYHQRFKHRLPQWHTEFVSWIKTLPYNEFITGEFDE